MSLQQELLFDLIESEAEVNIFLDRPNFEAKTAGIIITGSSVGHFPKKKSDKLTLWFGRGLFRESFKNKKLAYARAIVLLKTATTVINPRIEGRDAKKFIKLWEANQ